MIQDLFIIGATGNVGGTFINQILENGGVNPCNPGQFERIVGLASKTNFVFSPEGLSKQQIASFRAKNYQGTQRFINLGELVEDVDRNYRQNSSRLVFVDATNAIQPMTHFHLEVLGRTHYGIATANKNPTALSHYAVFKQLTEDPTMYGYRCSVMAGAGAVDFLRDSLYLGDRLHKIEGCFSGTLNYIPWRMEEIKFSEALAEARGRYTEPDPREDLNGLDVARKVIVLARTAGYNVGLEDIKMDPFIPKEYFVAGESIEDFMERAKGELDEMFAERIVKARERGMVLRYPAVMEVDSGTPKVELSLKEVPKDSDLGRLKGTLNQIEIYSTRYKEYPILIKAPGAGVDITASNIGWDLLYLPGGIRHPSSVR
ncbi:hypothetical protein HYT53_04965 [Candidatus Woesearchaeota archaeon]|nr:hypothetical protein [Candidatus Woesearchaeota archaeon]